MAKSEKLEEKEKVVYLCAGIGTPSHNSEPTIVGIYLIQENGDTIKIGEAETCGAQGFDDKKNESWDCWKYPRMLWKNKEFPYHQIRREDVGKPSYWLTWGWHFARTQNGRYVNFNELGVDFFCFDKLKLEHQKTVTFVKRHKLSNYDTVVKETSRRE